MATAKPLAGEPELGEDESDISFDDYRKAVQKYPSDNVRLDKEFRIAYPSTTMATFDQLGRDDKIDAVARARMLLNAGNTAVTMSVEHLLGDHDKDEFESPQLNPAHAGEHLLKPITPPADASIAQMLLLMQQQQAQQMAFMQQQQAQQMAAMQKQMRRGEELAEQRAEQQRVAAEQRAEEQRAANERQIRILTDQLEATRQSAVTNNVKFDVRFKRAKELVSGALGRMPDAARDLVKFFETAERFFKLYSIDADLQCPLLNTLLSDKAKQLLHRIPVDAIKTFDDLRTNLLREFKLTPQFYCEQFATSYKYKNDNFTQYATRVEVDFKLYLQSRKIQDGDYNQLRQLMIHDKFYQSIPAHLHDFATLCEMDGWVEAQKLAEKLDLYSCDRKVDTAYNHSNSGPPKPRQGGNSGSGGAGKPNNPGNGNAEKKFTEGGSQSQNLNSSNNQNQNSKKAQPKEFGNPKYCGYCKRDTHWGSDCYRDPKSAKYRPPGEKPAGSNFGTKPQQGSNNNNNKPNSSAARRLEVWDRSEDGCRSFTLGHPRDELEGLPPPDSLRVETRIVDRVHHHTESVGSEAPGNKTEVSPTPETHRNEDTLTIPLQKVALVSLGRGSVEAIIDSGAEMTVCHPDVVPPELITQAEVNGEHGSVILRSAFGEELPARTYHIPCHLLRGPRNTVCTPAVLLYCAVTPQLRVDKMLLSAEDYATMEQAMGGVVIPPTVPPDKWESCHSVLDYTHETGDLNNVPTSDTDGGVTHNMPFGVELGYERGSETKHDPVVKVDAVTRSQAKLAAQSDPGSSSNETTQTPANLPTLTPVQVTHQDLRQRSSPTEGEPNEHTPKQISSDVGGHTNTNPPLAVTLTDETVGEDVGQHVRELIPEGEVIKFRSEQESDDGLASCFAEAAKTKSDYVYHRDTHILFHRARYRDRSYLQVVVPTCHRTRVVSMAHDDAGHWSFKKTLQILRPNYFWPGMRKDVENYVRSCEACQRRARVTVADSVPIVSITRPANSFEVVHIDLMGPIDPPSSRGHKYVLGVIDQTTRWVEAVPLRTLTARETCDALLSIFQRISLPRLVISDNGTNFVAELTREMYNRLGIELRTSAPYAPFTNGLIERWWGSLKKMLHHIVTTDEARSWDRKLPMLLWAYRNLPNETTGLTPHELLFGRAGRGPLEVLRDTWTGETENLPHVSETALQYLARLKSDLRIANEVASSNALVRQEAYVHQHNLRARDKSFEEGDQVLILFGDSSSKLHSRWQGPGVVQSRISTNKYLVSLEDGSTRIFHVNHLRPFRVRIAALGVVFETDVDFGHIEYCPTTLSVEKPVDTRFDDLDLIAHAKRLGLTNDAEAEAAFQSRIEFNPWFF